MEISDILLVLLFIAIIIVLFIFLLPKSSSTTTYINRWFPSQNRPPYIPYPQPQPHPQPHPQPLIGGCSGTRYGCCPNSLTAKSDARGSNCLLY